ncbi:Ran binding domain [Sesbania bispinosa]|nr:Ran binding domain [Sesbania bispinosa]
MNSEPFHFGSFGSLDLHREEEDAPTGEDEDTGIQVTTIIKLEEVSLSTGEEDDESILDLKMKLHRFDKNGNHSNEQGFGTVKFLNTNAVRDSASNLNKSSDAENESETKLLRNRFKLSTISITESQASKTGMDVSKFVVACVADLDFKYTELNDDCEYFESFSLGFESFSLGIGVTDLLGYEMKSLNNVIVGNYVARLLFDEMFMKNSVSKRELQKVFVVMTKRIVILLLFFKTVGDKETEFSFRVEKTHYEHIEFVNVTSNLLSGISHLTHMSMSIQHVLLDELDPMVSIMKVEKAALESYVDIGGERMGTTVPASLSALPPAKVFGLFIYPVKSCHGISLSRAPLTHAGLRWDREWMVVNSKGRACTQRVEPKLALVEVEFPH